MTAYYMAGLADDFTDEVRRTMKSPEYGHPAYQEVAGGTGPCRVCFEQFHVGKEERILFTYRPASAGGNLGAPGPVVIHARRCQQYSGSSFPPGLKSLPLLIEGIARDNRIPASRKATGEDVDAALGELLANPDVEYLHVRHGEAGCHIVRIDRSAK